MLHHQCFTTNASLPMLHHQCFITNASSPRSSPMLHHLDHHQCFITNASSPMVHHQCFITRDTLANTDMHACTITHIDAKGRCAATSKRTQSEDTHVRFLILARRLLQPPDHPQLPNHHWHVITATSKQAQARGHCSSIVSQCNRSVHEIHCMTQPSRLCACGACGACVHVCIRAEWECICGCAPAVGGGGAAPMRCLRQD